MTRNELERYLGKCVTITLLDNTVIEGTLHKTGEKAFENNPNLSIPVNFYFCTDVNNKVVKKTVFRVSHIQKISCNEKLRMTNFEKIKSMNKEQMTDFIFHALYDDICDYCENCGNPCNEDEDCLENEEIIKKWLESEVDSND